MTITVEDAREYVLNHLTDLGYEDIVITETLRSDGEMVVFRFTMKDWQEPQQFDVWIEDEKIYGEW